MSIWGTIGKAAGYALSPFTGGLSLLAEPAIGAIEGAQHGGGLKGALKGGAIGGVEAAIPYGMSKLAPAGSVMSKLLGAGGSGPAGKTMSNMLGSAVSQAGGQGSGPFTTPTGPNASNPGIPGLSPLDSRSTAPSVSGGFPNAPSSIAGADTGGTGFIDKLLAGVKNPQTSADIGSVLGNTAEAEAQNRYKKADLTQSYDQLMLNAQTDRNQNESDAMKKAGQTAYIMGGGNAYTPPVLNSGTAGSFGTGPKATSPFEQQAAGELQGQLLDRLKPGGSYTPTKPDYLNRGKLENVGQYGGLASTGISLIEQLMGGQRPQPYGYQPVKPGGNLSTNPGIDGVMS